MKQDAFSADSYDISASKNFGRCFSTGSFNNRTAAVGPFIFNVNNGNANANNGFRLASKDNGQKFRHLRRRFQSHTYLGASSILIFRKTRRKRRASTSCGTA